MIQLPDVNFINAYHFGYVERYCFTITVEYLYNYISIATVKSNFIAKDGTGTMILLFFFLFYLSTEVQIVLRRCQKQFKAIFPCVFLIVLFSFYEHSFPHITSQYILSDWIKKPLNSKIIPLWKNDFHNRSNNTPSCTLLCIYQIVLYHNWSIVHSWMTRWNRR